MNKIILLLLFTAFCFAGCSANSDSVDKKQEEVTPSDTKKIIPPPQQVKGNLSMIEGEILGNYRESETDYILKIRTSVVAKVDENENLASLGEEIFFTPNFILDENGSINSDKRNDRLKLLSKAKRGQTVRIHAFYVLKKGWYIKDYLIKSGE